MLLSACFDAIFSVDFGAFLCVMFTYNTHTKYMFTEFCYQPNLNPSPDREFHIPHPSYRPQGTLARVVCPGHLVLICVLSGMLAACFPDARADLVPTEQLPPCSRQACRRVSSHSAPFSLLCFPTLASSQTAHLCLPSVLHLTVNDFAKCRLYLYMLSSMIPLLWSAGLH